MQDSRTGAKAYALKLLGYRSRSRKELRERLNKKGFPSDQIDSSIHALEQAGLINDENLALELLRYSVERKKLGIKGIEAFLAKRGLDKDLILKTLTAHTQEAEEESARLFVERKLKTLRNYPYNVMKRKIFGMLQRRGFSMEVIHGVIRSLPHDKKIPGTFRGF